MASDVDTFVQFLQKKFDKIRSLEIKTDPGEDSESAHLFKRVLYVGIIDVLSKTVFPKKENRDRTVSFIRKFCDWQHSEKVSLPHLARLLKKSPEPEFSGLRQLVGSEMGKWKQGTPMGLDKDIDEEAIRPLWPKEKEYEKPLKNVSLESIKHIHLFYAYRNSLIHEMRKPGYGVDFDPSDQDPYYHSMSHVGHGGTKSATWELVYPVGFIERLCKKALNEVREYYIREQLNPYDTFAFGSYWIEELNR